MFKPAKEQIVIADQPEEELLRFFELLIQIDKDRRQIAGEKFARKE